MVREERELAGDLNSNKNGLKLKIVLVIIFFIILTNILSNLKSYEIPEVLQNIDLDLDSSSGNYNETKFFDNNRLFSIHSPVNETIWVIDARNLSKSECVTALSLQGIVNRKSAALYLIHNDLDVQWLNYINKTSNQNPVLCALSEAIEMNYNVLNGAVLYDDNDISLNLATTLAGINDAIMIKDDDATYDLEIILDATKYQDHSYSDLLKKYFKNCNRNVIANFRPHDVLSRDYIIQNRMFCMFLEPGPFSNPFDNYEYIDIIEEFSQDGNGCNRWLFGWFQTPTITEEDYAIQSLSHYGISFLPCTNVPNLSILQAYNVTIETNETTKKQTSAKDKVYITFGMADGDSLGFMYEYMNSYWSDKNISKIPMAWSINTVVREIAPIILKYYNDNAAQNHTFIASGSGLGLVFPDFFKPKILNNYIERSAEFGFDKVWLLNSYTPYETRYSNKILKKYAEHYNGIVLDYGSLPIKGPSWKQYDTPFVRSLHYMGDTEDFKAKFHLTTTFNDKPTFIYITLYPWSELDIPAMLDIIDRTCDDYEFLDLHQFFDLLNKTAKNRYHFDDTRRSLGSTVQYEYELQSIMINEGWIILVAINTLIIWSAIVRVKKHTSSKELNTKEPELNHLIYFGGVNTLYLSMVFWVLYQNYWQWTSLALIMGIAAICPFFRDKQEPKGKRFLNIYTYVLCFSALVSIAFPFVLLICAIAYFKIISLNTRAVVKTYPLSVNLSIILSFLVWTTWMLLPLILVLILSSSELLSKTRITPRNHDGTVVEISGKPKIKSETKLKTESKSDSKSESKKTIRSKLSDWIIDVLSTLLPSVYISLIVLPAFYLDMYFVNLKMSYNSHLILASMLLIPIISYAIGRWLLKYEFIIKRIFPFTWFLIFFSPTPIIMLLILIFIQAQIYTIGISLYRDNIENTTLFYKNLDFAINLSALPIVIGLVIIFPPMIFSIYFLKLSYDFLFILYYTPFLYAIITLLFLVGIVVLEKSKRLSEKRRSQKSKI